MKKILSLVVAMAFVASASAQVAFKCDFEDGTVGKWTPWQQKVERLGIVEGEQAKDSKYAMSYQIGCSITFFNIKAGSTYKLSFDSDLVSGKSVGFCTLAFMNKDIGKIEELFKIDVPAEKGYKKIEHTFTAKSSTMHRLTLGPGNGGAKYLVDNIKIELVK